jgi:hypothetical protein
MENAPLLQLLAIHWASRTIEWSDGSLTPIQYVWADALVAFDLEGRWHIVAPIQIGTSAASWSGSEGPRC